MLNEKSLKLLFFSLTLVLIMIGASCTNTSLESNDWTVTTNKKTKTFSIEHSELGLVLKEMKPQVERNSKIISPSDWKVGVEENQLTIITDKSEQTAWEIKAEQNYISLSCSSDSAVVKERLLLWKESRQDSKTRIMTSCTLHWDWFPLKISTVFLTGQQTQ